MNIVHMEATRVDSKNPVDIEKFNKPKTRRRPATPRAVLEEVFELLEDYAPAWYTEEHHNRIVEALLDENLR